jgi:hypothetical protein
LGDGSRPEVRGTPVTVLPLSQVAAGPTPDYIEPVEAWRVWRVGMREGRVVLESLFADTVWEPGVRLAARCVMGHRSRWRPWRRVPNDHAVPDLRCTCGIYGVRSLAAARWYLETRSFISRGDRVIGRVALWGDVVESQLGWRASRAYPLELLVPALGAAEGGFRHRAHLEEIVVALEAYRVPVDLAGVQTFAAA